MKKNKMILSVICVILLLVSAFSYTASALVINDGDFGYEMNAYTKEMTLVQYNGKDTIVTIPGYYSQYPVTAINSSALSGNAAVQEINVPTTMKKIGNKAFSNCTALSAVRFPSFVSTVGEQVCLNCTSLQSAFVDAPIETLPAYSFSGCTSLMDVQLSSSVTAIGAYAFQDCNSLTNINFLQQIDSIGRHAFDGIGIEELTFPDSICEIPDYVFANCSKLSDVTILDNVTFISPTAFANDNITIHCYYNSYAYQYALENSIPYVLLDNVLLGDANGDGAVNINDVTTIQRYLAELETIEGIYLRAADVNQDGTVDIADATAIQMYLAEYEVDYTIGEIMAQ